MTMCMKCGRRQGGEYKGDPSACACGRGPESPERLWVLELGHGERAACLTEEEAATYETHVEDEDRVRPAEYVLASVAASRAVEAERARILASVVDALNAAYEEGRDEPDMTGFVLGALTDACGSTDADAERFRASKAKGAALRRERDALLAERDAVAREGWRACVLGVSIIRFWQAETKSRSGDQRGALALMNEAVALRDIFTAGDKAAGKGVG